jgi:hypothetical protein
LNGLCQFLSLCLVEDNNIINWCHSTCFSLFLNQTGEFSGNSSQEQLLVMCKIKNNCEVFSSSNSLILISLVKSKFIFIFKFILNLIFVLLLLDLDCEMLVEFTNFSLDCNLSSFLQLFNLFKVKVKFVGLQEFLEIFLVETSQGLEIWCGDFLGELSLVNQELDLVNICLLLDIDLKWLDTLQEFWC